MNNNGFDIDEWEDMLPVERRYEKEHSFSNCSSGKVPGWMIVCILLLLYAVLNAIAS